MSPPALDMRKRNIWIMLREIFTDHGNIFYCCLLYMRAVNREENSESRFLIHISRKSLIITWANTLGPQEMTKIFQWPNTITSQMEIVQIWFCKKCWNIGVWTGEGGLLRGGAMHTQHTTHQTRINSFRGSHNNYFGFGRTK